MLRLPEVEGEGVEQLVRAEPDVPVRPDDEIGLEGFPAALAQPRGHAVRGDDQIGVRELEIGIHLALENEPHAERLATPLQNVEQLLAPDPDEAVTGRADARGP